MWIVASFSHNDIPALGLSPIINIRDVSTGTLLVDSAPMVEKGDGFYGYFFTAYDSTMDYIYRCDSLTLPDSERYTYGASGEYNDALNSITTAVNNIDTRTILIKKLQTNRLELGDGQTNNWILYDDDDTTPIYIFNVSGKNGEPILTPPHAPARRSKGYEL